MRYKLLPEQVVIIVAMILFAIMCIISCLGCAQDPKVLRERENQRKYAEEMLPCVIKKITTDTKGRIRETYYQCIEDNGIYRMRSYLGNEGDTVKVMRQRMYSRQN